MCGFRVEQSGSAQIMSYYLGARGGSSGGLPSPPRWVSKPAALPAGVSPNDIFKFMYDLHWDANAEQYEWMMVPHVRTFFPPGVGAIVVNPGDPLHWPAPITVAWARCRIVSKEAALENGITNNYLVLFRGRKSSEEHLRSVPPPWIWMRFGRDGVGGLKRHHGY